MTNLIGNIVTSLNHVVSHSIKRTSVLLLTGLTCLVGSALWTPVNAQSPANVRLDLRTTSTRIRLNGQFVAAASLLNQGTDQAVVLRGNPGFRTDGGLRLKITDSSRTSRDIQAPRGEFAPSDVPNSGRYFLLAPRERLEMLVQLPARQLFSEPGRYEVTVEYTSALPSRQNEPNRGVEGATARSAPLVIEVLP